MSAPWEMHPYQYVNQNPILFWDPDGRQAEPVPRPPALPTAANDNLEKVKKLKDVSKVGKSAAPSLARKAAPRILGRVLGFLFFFVPTQAAGPCGTQYPCDANGNRKKRKNEKDGFPKRYEPTELTPKQREELSYRNWLADGNEGTFDDWKAGEGRKRSVRQKVGNFYPAPGIGELPGFPGTFITPRKTWVQGGGAMRKRWKDNNNFIYEWDYENGMIEKYTPKGHHLGEFDPDTGKQRKDPEPGRIIEP